MPEEPAADPAGPLLSRANLARVRGNLEEGISLCKMALAQSPASVEAHVLLSELYAAQGKEDEALHYLSLAVDLKPDNAALRDKRDKRVQTRHARLVAAQKSAAPQAQAVKPAPPPPTAKPRKAPPRTIVAVFIGIGGLVMLLLGVWLGIVLSHRNDLPTPTKTPGTVGRKDAP